MSHIRAISSGFFLGCFVLVSCVGTGYAQTATSKMMRKNGAKASVAADTPPLVPSSPPGGVLPHGDEPDRTHVSAHERWDTQDTTSSPSAPPAAAITTTSKSTADKAATPALSSRRASEKAGELDVAKSRDVLKRDLASRIVARREELPICRTTGGPSGRSEATVVFQGTGGVSVRLEKPFLGTPAGDCIARRFERARSTFEGDPIAIVVAFEL